MDAGRIDHSKSAMRKKPCFRCFDQASSGNNNVPLAATPVSTKSSTGRARKHRLANTMNKVDIA
jgi:hypothetical protein